VPSGDDMHYLPSDQMHYLDDQYMRYTLPGVQVKPTYRDVVRIAWTRWAGPNLIKSARMDIDEEKFEMSSGVLDIQAMWYQKAGFREAYEMQAGNMEELTNWTTELPRFQGDVPQPWYFTTHITQGLPLFMLPHRVKFVYNYRSFTELLRMQIKTSELSEVTASAGSKSVGSNGSSGPSGLDSPDKKAAPDKKVAKLGASSSEWTDVNPAEYLHCLVESLADLSARNTPEMWASYTYSNATEKDFWMSCGMGKHGGKIKGWRSYELPVYHKFTSINGMTFGKRVEVTIDTSLPIRSIHFMASNQNSLKKHGYSNYTTNATDPKRGVSPIVDYQLTSSDAKIEKRQASHSQFIQAYRHFPSYPNDAGYHALCFVDKLPAHDHDVSLNSRDGKHTLQVLIDDPGHTTDDPETEFMLEVYALVVHKMDLILKGAKWQVYLDTTDADILAQA